MINDIRLSNQFYRDYAAAPERVQKTINKLIEMILDSGRFPNSMHVHVAHSAYNDLYIGYVTRNGQHWRVLFEIGRDKNDNEFLVMMRLLDHDKTTKYLTQYV